MLKPAYGGLVTTMIITYTDTEKYLTMNCDLASVHPIGQVASVCYFVKHAWWASTHYSTPKAVKISPFLA